MGKHFRLLKDMAYNSAFDVIRVVYDDEDDLYYYDGADRYCYIEKSAEGKEWEYYEAKPVLFVDYGGSVSEYLDEEVDAAIREISTWVGDNVDFENMKVTITIHKENL